MAILSPRNVVMVCKYIELQVFEPVLLHPEEVRAYAAALVAVD
jgi:hypothetical protein